MRETTNVSDEPVARLKEIKVRIPLSFHVRLHSMKVLHGTPISAAITEALDRYFADETPEPPEAVPDRGDGL